MELAALFLVALLLVAAVVAGVVMAVLLHLVAWAAAFTAADTGSKMVVQLQAVGLAQSASSGPAQLAHSHRQIQGTYK